MTDEIALRRQMDRSARAQNLMNDELLKEAFTVLESEYLEFWKATPVRDQDARERVFHAINVIGKVKQHLVTVLNDGKVAKVQLDEFLTTQARKAGAQKNG